MGTTILLLIVGAIAAFGLYDKYRWSRSKEGRSAIRASRDPESRG